MIVVVMGPTGTGKSTLGRMLARELGWAFIEGDDYHPTANVEKMRRGEPLDDADRWPWLDALRAEIARYIAADRSAVVTCSALKRRYRERLQLNTGIVRFFLLQAEARLLRRRLKQRAEHFMPAELVDSQLETLELGEDLVSFDASQAPAAVVAAMRQVITTIDDDGV